MGIKCIAQGCVVILLVLTIYCSPVLSARKGRTKSGRQRERNRDRERCPTKSPFSNLISDLKTPPSSLPNPPPKSAIPFFRAAPSLKNICLFKPEAAECQGSHNARRLMDDLFRKSSYNAWLRPVFNERKNLTVHFGAGLAEIEDLDENNGRATYRLMLTMWWNDYQLQWDPVEYNALRKIYVPSNMIWTPDIDLYNGIESKINQDVLAQVYSDGNVLWMVPAHFSSTCTHEFRSDSWHCPMYFRSWTQDATEMDIIPFKDNTDLETGDLFKTIHWSVLSGHGQRVMKTYSCCENAFPVMEYLLKMRNKIGHPAFLGKRSTRGV